MGLFKKFINQTARPEGILGRLMIRGMNCGHAKLADWGISTLGIGEPDEILDIGCGGGRHIHKMLRLYPGARGAAVDCSPLCVRKAAEYNRKEIRAGRLAVDVGDAADLPSFPNVNKKKQVLERVDSLETLTEASGDAKLPAGVCAWWPTAPD